MAEAACFNDEPVPTASNEDVIVPYRFEPLLNSNASDSCMLVDQVDSDIDSGSDSEDDPPPPSPVGPDPVPDVSAWYIHYVCSLYTLL